jgi:poly(A) polymerase
MLACMLWHDVQGRWQALRDAGEPPFPALQQAIDAVFDARIGDISGRGKLAADMREIWQMQPRFERRTASSAASLASQARFRAGYDFLRLRADVGEVDVELADWWEDYHLGNDEERDALVLTVRESQGARKVGTVRRVPAAAASASTAAPSTAGAAAEDDGDSADQADPGENEGDMPAGAEGAPVKRRRRRRRKPAGEGSTAGSGGDPAA